MSLNNYYYNINMITRLTQTYSAIVHYQLCQVDFKDSTFRARTGLSRLNTLFL